MVLTMTHKRTDERAEYLADVLDAAISGASYWLVEVEHNGSEDARTSAYTLTDVDDETHTVNIDTIARGFGLYRGETFQGAEYGRQTILSNRTNGADGDYDADTADNVLQLGIFGEIPYG